MRVFNSIGPSIDLKSTPLVTGLQLDFAPLIIISWAWHFSLFSIYFTIYLSSQQLVNADTASDESLSEVKTINILCSLLLHQASHLITEGYQVDQAWFSPSNIHTDDSQSSPCPQYILKYFPEWFVPTPVWVLRQGWLACSSPHLIWHLHPISSPPLITVTFQRYRRLALQWHLPAPSHLRVQPTGSHGLVCVKLVLMFWSTLLRPTGLRGLGFLKTNPTNTDRWRRHRISLTCPHPVLPQPHSVAGSHFL